MSTQDVADFVFQAVADGASSVTTCTEGCLCDTAGVSKVKAFVAAAKEAKRMLGTGATRQDVGRLVSSGGRTKFWAHWPGKK